MNKIIELDHYLFGKINLDWTNAFFDWYFPAITDLHKNPWFLVALLPLLGFWVYKQQRVALKWILVLICAVGLTDFFNYRLVKETVQRDRPEFTGIEVHLRTHQHTGTSFPSNHAGNIFAAATVLSAALPAGAPLYFFIAASVAYSRVYVGVHFPLDVICGALFGVIIALLLRATLGRWLFKPPAEDEASGSLKS